MTDFRSKWFACLEFKLVAYSAAQMFKSDDTEHYTTIGHDDARCSAITEKRKVEHTSLSEYLAEHEYFDGELTFADPWPCSKCIPTEALPEWAPTKDQEVRKVPTEPTVKTNLKPYRTALPGTPVPPDAKIKPADSATDKQVGMLMRLYRASQPTATKEAIKAAETRARCMTKRQASATIDKMVKASMTQDRETT